jgi:hypothetical protein
MRNTAQTAVEQTRQDAAQTAAFRTDKSRAEKVAIEHTSPGAASEY